MKSVSFIVGVVLLGIALTMFIGTVSILVTNILYNTGVL